MDETRVALIGVILNDETAVESINKIFYDYRDYIIGRMGLPYKARNISVISIVIDAPQTVISAITGKLGMIKHVSTKTVYAKLPNI